MKKLSGHDIITLIKVSASNKEVYKEAQNLTSKDFIEDDLVVKTFFTAFPDGFTSASFDATDKVKVAQTLSSVKQEITDQGLRKAFSLLQNLRNAGNDAVVFENSCNEFNPIKGIQGQFKAAQLVSFLSKYIDGQKNKDLLSQAHNLINNGELDQASECIREAFSGNDKNIKTAFVTIKQQVGEPYMLCPKGIYIWGAPRPMPVSNCREYCIDAKCHPDGTVSCNYLKWLKDSMINHEQVKNLFDTIEVEHDTMNLEPGQRSKFPMSQQDSQDMRIIRNVETVNEPRETQLERIHNKKPESFKKPKALATDSALEVLLKDCRDVFDESDLDVLEAQIREFVEK